MLIELVNASENPAMRWRIVSPISAKTLLQTDFRRVSVSALTNQMLTVGNSVPTYDANGNVLNDFLHQYTWDANGRPVTITGPTNVTVSAVYDALGRIAEFSYSSNTREVVYSPQGGKLALMNGQSLVSAFIPLPGGATAVYNSSGLAFYRHSDWLGSARLATTTTQTIYNDVAYAPYGETYAQSGTPDFSFTGMNEDVEQNANPATLYDFPAREYGIQGRWPSPDPAGMGAVDPTDPQTWNRYAYVGNRPLGVTDPSGTCADGSALCFLCPINPVVCVVAGIADIFCLFLCHHHDTPHAPPAPNGGYGAGIDPFCGDFVSCGQMPSFQTPIGPGLPGSWVCNYDPGSCSGVISGFTAAEARQRLSDYLHWLLSRPWMLSWIIPVLGEPGAAGAGPAGSVVYNPQTHTVCASIGIGASVGDNVSIGPLTQVHTNPGYKTDDIFRGGSLSGGFNTPIGPGVQGTINSAGRAGGWDLGVPGLSGSSTTGTCVSLN